MVLVSSCSRSDVLFLLDYHGHMGIRTTSGTLRVPSIIPGMYEYEVVQLASLSLPTSNSRVWRVQLLCTYDIYQVPIYQAIYQVLT